MRVLLLRLAAPLMSFGAVRVDARGPTADHPGLGLVTGLIANALGYDHAEADRLTRLQERLRLASRCDRRGERITDFQTVDLGQDFLAQGWTTRGVVERRNGGPASYGTHIRLRDYHADRIQTVALILEPADEKPTLDECAAALDAPARPLFIGRKPCLPTMRLRLGIIEAEDLRTALAAAPRASHRHLPPTQAADLDAWWPADSDQPEDGTRLHAVVDERDWRGQVVAGRRLVRQGRVRPPEVAHA